jgi:hypothetical protein
VNRENYWFVLAALFFSTCVFGKSVERITFLARQPGVFVGSVRAGVNSKTDSTLVVWEKQIGTQDHHSIWGKLISSNGNPSGQAFQIVGGPNAQTPKVAYNFDTNEFLLVFANETNGENRFEIFAQKLNANGRRIGRAVRVSLATDRGKNIRNDLPQVIYDAKALGYVVMWRRYLLLGSTVPDQGLLGAVLNSNLTVRQAPVLMSHLQGDFNRILGPVVTDLGFHPVNGKLLIAGFSESNSVSSSWQYFVARADATLQKPQIVLTPLKLGLSSGAAPYAGLVFLPGNSVGALFVEGTGVRKRKINALGVPNGPISPFFTGPVETVPLEFPISTKASITGRSETAVVGVDDSSTQTGKLWLQTAGSSGTAIGQPFELQSNLDIGAQPAITPLPIPAPSGFWYAVIFVEGVRRGVDPIESTGLVLLKVNTAP